MVEHKKVVYDSIYHARYTAREDPLEVRLEGVDETMRAENPQRYESIDKILRETTEKLREVAGGNVELQAYILSFYKE